MSYAIAVLPDQNVTDWATICRRGLAMNFPVHITLKSRFRVRSGVSVTDIVSDVKHIFEIPCFDVKLSGPYYIDGRIRWIESLAGNEGAEVLNDLHRSCVKKILAAPYASDYKIPSAYEVDGFRPHITLDWNDQGIFVPTPGIIDETLIVRAVFDRWVVMQYTEDYLRRGVKVVYEADLQ